MLSVARLIDRQKGLADFANEPEDKHARIIRSICSGRLAGRVPHRSAQTAGCAAPELDIAQLRQQMTPAGSIAPVGRCALGNAIEIIIDRVRHLAL